MLLDAPFSISPYLADFLPEFLKPAVVGTVPTVPENAEVVVVAAEANSLDEESSASLNDVMNSAKFDLKKIIEERRAQILERKAALKGLLPNPIPKPASTDIEQPLNDVKQSHRYIQMPSSKFDLKKIIEERRAQILERKAALKGAQPVPIPIPASPEESLNDEGTASHGAVVDFKKLIEERRAEILKRINAQKAAVQPLDDATPSAHIGLKEIIENRRAEILKIKAAQQSLVEPQQDIERTMPLRPLNNKLS
ncbi:hypothetical protein PRIPAC_82592, partial [Pristionchus pacificus]|uniref:Uncharacterized protein n=1 Tax=Pristionchus pacificus TaxID=54126 RepID=A0A2A6C2W1_PRIPA